jgi:hypothetical protein
MKKQFLLIFIFSYIFCFKDVYSQNIQNSKNETLIVYGIVTNVISDISTFEKYHGYLCKLKDVSVISGTYSKDTISVIINTSSMMRLYNDKKVIISAQLYKNIFATFREQYDFSPFYSTLVINKTVLDFYGVSDTDSLIKPYKEYFSKTSTVNIEDKISITFNYVHDKEKPVPLRIFAVNDLKSIYSIFGNSYYYYIKKLWFKIYENSNLEEEIRKEAFKMIGSWSEESRLKIEPISLENLDSYFVPLWEKGVVRCDSLISVYKNILKNYPSVKDTISLSNGENLFFSGKIKKVSNNTLTIKNLTIFEGKYSKEEITLRTDIDTTFNKKIIGENILISATIINNKYILELNSKNKCFTKPPLSPDGNNLFLINDSNLNKNRLKIEPEELIILIR